MDLALNLDPYNSFFHLWSANQFIDQGRPDEGLVELDRVAALEPGEVHWAPYRAYYRKRQFQQAIAHLKNLYSYDPEVVQALERGYVRGGYKSALIATADVIAAKGAEPDQRIGQLYAAAGADDRALYWLENAYQKRQRGLVIANATAEFEHLRALPRFQALMRGMNLAQ